MILQRNRVYELIVGDYKSEDADALLINNLQVRFEVSKSSSNRKRANSATIEVTNLSEEHLKTLQTDYIAAVFSAGYLDCGGAKRLFSGQVKEISTRKQGTDRVTQILMGEGYQELNHQLLNELVPPGKTVKEGFEAILKSIPGVDRGVFNGMNVNNPLIYGYPLMGTPREMLDELAEKYNIDYQIDDGVAYVHDSDRASSEKFEEAYVVSKYTGLIENAYYASGERTKSKKDKEKKQSVQWKMLLNPDITAGSIVKLEDTLISGWFKVDSLRHTGAWRDIDWFTEVQCSAIEKVVKNK